jgi:hypothetical protein
MRWRDNARPRLIFLGQHDRQHARGLRRIGRIVRPELKREVVVVDFPEEIGAVDGDGAEVVLAVGIVFGREDVEALHQSKYPRGDGLAERRDAGCEAGLASGERLAESVVELLDFGRAARNAVEEANGLDRLVTQGASSRGFARGFALLRRSGFLARLFAGHAEDAILLRGIFVDIG